MSLIAFRRGRETLCAYIRRHSGKVRIDDPLGLLGFPDRRPTAGLPATPPCGAVRASGHWYAGLFLNCPLPGPESQLAAF